MASLGEDGLGVELHSVDGRVAMTERHHHIAGTRGDRDVAGQRPLVDHQRVVSRRGHGIGQVLEEAGSVMGDHTDLAVDRLRSALHDCVNGQTNGLVTEAHAQERQARLDAGLHQRDADPGVLGAARTRREENPGQPEPGRIGHGDVIIAAHNGVDSELLQVLDEVVHKGVVVVDDENTDRHPQRIAHHMTSLDGTVKSHPHAANADAHVECTAAVQPVGGVDLEVHPSPHGFAALARDHNLIPVHVSLHTDTDTPISIFRRLRDRRPLCLLESAGGGEGAGRYSFIGLDPHWTLSSARGVVELAADHDAPIALEGAPLAELRRLLQQYQPHCPSDLPRFFGGAVGWLSYDYVRRLEKLPTPETLCDWPEAMFGLPSVLVVYDHLQHRTTIIANATVDRGVDPSAQYDNAVAQLGDVVEEILDGAILANDEDELRLVSTLSQKRERLSAKRLAAMSNRTEESYGAMVERAKEHIVAGDIFQVVPSQVFHQPFTGDCFLLYRTLRALNPSPYMFYLDFGEHQLVGASPEALVRVESGHMTTHPIAGSRPRGANEDEDRRLERELLADTKEMAEHVMLVDLARNDLGRVAQSGSVRTTRLAAVERYSHILHIVSTVEAELADGKDCFDALDACFPAGTLSGAPKIRAMEIITELEQRERGAYGGCVGYFSVSGNADFAITIRSVAVSGGEAIVQAGGGVVADSVPEREFAESINKAMAPLLAIELQSATARQNS